MLKKNLVVIKIEKKYHPWFNQLHQFVNVIENFVY